MEDERSRALVDIGANLSHSSFSDDLDAVLHRASEQRVGEIVVTGTSVEGSRQASALSAEHAGRLFATAGIHPHEAGSFDPGHIDILRDLAGQQGVCAVGETGLDYNRNYAARDDQLRCFEAQLDLAAELNMPVFIHERDAAEDMISMLGRYRSRIDKIVVHCFTGSEDTLRAYLDMDLHIGITGWICDERRGLGLRDLVGLIPAGRLMLETDAPYLMPRDYPERNYLQSSRRNEPCTLSHIAACIAEHRQEDYDTLREHSRQTSIEFFGLNGQSA